jgi:hypothetical protein
MKNIYSKVILIFNLFFSVIVTTYGFLIWLVAQFDSQIPISYIFNVENSLNFLLIIMIPYICILEVIMKNISRKDDENRNIDRLIQSSEKENGKWIGYFISIYIFSELSQRIIWKKASNRVLFSENEWTVSTRLSNIIVTETMAHDLMWNQCRTLAGILVILSSGCVLKIYLHLKFISRR